MFLSLRISRMIRHDDIGLRLSSEKHMRERMEEIATRKNRTDTLL